MAKVTLPRFPATFRARPAAAIRFPPTSPAPVLRRLKLQEFLSPRSAAGGDGLPITAVRRARSSGASCRRAAGAGRAHLCRWTNPRGPVHPTPQGLQKPVPQLHSRPPSTPKPPAVTLPAALPQLASGQAPRRGGGGVREGLPTEPSASPARTANSGALREMPKALPDVVI